MFGIDDMAFHVPRIYLKIEDLAKERNIEYAKLNRGLGLHSMSLADVHEDASTMAANAVKSLIDKNQLSPESIGRIYVGSESATDGAKPIASYVLSMLSDCFREKYGEDAFIHTDVVDMTFACIAGVDAMQTTLDWVRADPSRQGIVVCTDDAKYELGSTGEYTQGAGAVAMLVKANPRLIVFDSFVGLATKGVHDFFKPVRRVSQKQLAGAILGSLNGNFKPFEIPNIIHSDDEYLEIYKPYPVYDGQYSNACYAARMQEAYAHFKTHSEGHDMDDWDRIAFHLPYAFHGKRTFVDLYYSEHRDNEVLNRELLELNPDFHDDESNKLVAKTPSYQHFHSERMEKGQRASSLIGNLYTGSIFMSLMSILESELNDGNSMDDKTIGFFAYGSGSKSKVFSGKIQKEWHSVVKKFNLFRTLDERQTIDFDEYEKLHRGLLTESIATPTNEFYLDTVNYTDSLYGERTYTFMEEVPVANQSQLL